MARYNYDTVTPEQIRTMTPYSRRKFFSTATKEQIERVTDPCDGEAHSNAFIDNCMICAPLWGRMLKRPIEETSEG